MDEIYRGLLGLAGVISVFSGAKRLAIGPQMVPRNLSSRVLRAMRGMGIWYLIWGVAALYAAIWGW